MAVRVASRPGGRKNRLTSTLVCVFLNLRFPSTIDTALHALIGWTFKCNGSWKFSMWAVRCGPSCFSIRIRLVWATVMTISHQVEVSAFIPTSTIPDLWLESAIYFLRYKMNPQF